MRIQDLKNQIVEELTNDNNAKGERSTNNFIKIYGMQIKYVYHIFALKSNISIKLLLSSIRYGKITK